MKIAFLTTDNREDSRSYEEPKPRFGTAPTALLEGLAASLGCEVHIVSCVQKPVQSPSTLAENVYYHSLVVGKWGWMRGGYLGCIAATRRKLRQIRPDIVHGQGTERNCAISAVFSGFPNVLTVHGNMRVIAEVNHAPALSHAWLAAKLEEITIPRSDGVVCITNYTRQAVHGLAKKTWVLPNAVDSAFFDLNPTPEESVEPQILCVGTVCPRKNQNAFIRALDPLVATRKFRVIFLGQIEEGDVYGSEFLRLIASRPWCSHEGFADRGTVRSSFKSSALLALPSLEDNCPMVVLEAMAAGIPVLASDVGGVPDLIQTGKTGLLCDPTRPETITKGINQLLGNPQLARQIASDAKQQARERFHPAVIAKRHIEIYREVLSARS